jgi:hypothetical protein
MKETIELLKDKTREEVINYLAPLEKFTPYQKNIIYVYLFPEPLKHMELLEVVPRSRGENKKGWLVPTESEILNLLRAYRTAQYKRFILHLLHSYIENAEGTYVVQEKDPEAECVICGKKLYGYDIWKNFSSEDPGREYLYYLNDQTELGMCIDCMVQLKALNDLLETIEGKDYLTSRKWIQ